MAEQIKKKWLNTVTYPLNKEIGWLVLPMSLACVLILKSVAFATPTRENSVYISQTYIDTLVQNAYTALTASEELSRAALKKEKAIALARRTVAKLKKMAESDKNKKYILWKVQELESQIFLEENGLVQEKDQKRRMEINELISPFNAEIAKLRPDFSKLENIRLRMKELDNVKERELRFSLNDRISAISMATVYALEQNIKKGDYDAARIDLAYCKSYQGLLTISLTQYSTLAAKVQAKVTVDNEKVFIGVTLEKAENACAKKDLGGARSLMQTIGVRLDGIKTELNEHEWDKLFFSNKKLAKTIAHKEDSLVSENLRILKTQGVGNATEYSESVLKKWDVSPDKISSVNYAILEAAVAKKKKDGPNLDNNITVPVDSSANKTTMIDDILAAAKVKAKLTEDSLRAEQDKMHLTQVERVRLNNMRIAALGKERREKKREKENQEKAKHLLVEMYTLLDKGKTKSAEKEFKNNLVFLKEHLAPDAFKKLETAMTHGDARQKK